MNIGAEGTGSLVVKELEAAGVDSEFITRDKINHTALSVIVSLKERDHTMFLYRGANDFLKVIDWRPLKTKWFYLTSLTGESGEVIPELFSYVRAHGIKIAWNPGSEQLEKGYYELEAYLDVTDILILNHDEAKQLIFSKVKNPKIRTMEEILSELYEMNHKLVVVTDGEKGSYVYDGKKVYFEPSSGGKPVETTGAGDAYGSTFTAGQILGMSIKDSMKMAATNAGSVVRNIGAWQGLMTIDELRAKIKVGGTDEIIGNT
jgi:sugar/nucleoside kinase (ribokinase family)